MIKKIVWLANRPNKGPIGGAGGVLFLQEQLLGHDYNGIKMEYHYSNQSSYEDEPICAASLVKRVITDDTSTYYVANDLYSAYELAKRGLPYSLIYHQQGPLIQELINFGRKLNDSEMKRIHNVERIAFQRARSVHFPSNGAKDMYFRNQYKSIEESEVSLGEPLYNTIIHNDKTYDDVIEIDGIRIEKNDGLTILSVGTITKAKGQDRSIQVINNLVSILKIPIRYIVVGNGPLSDEIDKSARAIEKKFNTFQYIRFKKLPHDDVLKLDSVSDIYLMMQRVSIFDLATLEAMEKGNALILSDCGGNPEYNICNNVLLMSDDYVLDDNYFNSDNIESMKKLNKQVFEENFSNTAFRKNYYGFISNINNKIPSVKVLVCYHKQSKIYSNNCYTPINVGRDLNGTPWLVNNMIGDNSGDNISKKNGSYCELTAYYWAWKNNEEINDPEYIGIMHYRRLLDFRVDEHQNIIDEKMLREACATADIILAKKELIYSKTAKKICNNFYEQYKNEQHIQDLVKTQKIIKMYYPEYYNDFIEVVYGMKTISWCNIIIAKKAIFYDYCEWLFGIFNYLESDINLENYSIEEKRVFGFISEILLNVYVSNKCKKDSLIVKQFNIIKTEDKMKTTKTKSKPILKRPKIIDAITEKILKKSLQKLFKPLYEENLKNSIFSTVRRSWNAYGSTEELIQYCRQMAISPYHWDINHSEVWLIFMCMLVERGLNKELEKTLKKYNNKHGWKSIQNYLPLSYYIWNNRPDSINNNAEIEIASKIYETLKANNEQFAKIVNGKTIAIVGNSSNQIGKNKGNEIDSHDIVIRFNNYELDGFENDYGKKTDIWVRGSGSKDVRDRDNIADYKLVIWEADYDHYRVYFDNLDTLYKNISEAPNTITNYNWNIHSELRNISGITFPTSGAVTIWAAYVANNKSFDNIDLYGFSFLDDNYNPNDHYFDNKCNLKDHDYENEQQFLKEIYQKIS
jgi:hypothetical protein